MIFTELRFLLFFAATWCVHWTLRGNGARKVFLLCCSYAFYCAWDWRFLVLILASSAIDFTAGRALGVTDSARARRAWLVASLVGNLGMLGFFKYYNFFVDSGNDLLTFLGLGTSLPSLRIILPVGISFYTFQSMSYTIDIFRRRLAPARSILDFAMFVGFFPQLVAGPIVRASDFLPQLDSKRLFRDVAVRAHLWIFLVGYIKKACLADNVSVIVDQVFADPAAYSTGGNWLGMVLYTVQIYCDFSGYSDMAVGTAGLLGYKLTINFDFPYLCRSIGEFWRRWHVSLSSWVMDYIYVPLGGSWVPVLARLRNIYLTMALMGLWHGAGWRYVTFGLVHATYIVIVRWWRHSPLRETRLGSVSYSLGILMTHWCLLLSWTIFRGESARGTLDQLRIFLFLGGAGDRTVSPYWWLVPLGAGLVHYGSYKGFLRERILTVPSWAFAAGFGALAALALPWAAGDYKPFIYFQF